MKKILVIKNGLSAGGTTSSFLAFLSSMANQKEIAVDVWVGNVDQGLLTTAIPTGVQCIQNDGLEEAFHIPQGKEKIIAMLKQGRLGLTLRYHLLAGRWRKTKKVIPLFQKMDIKKVRAQQCIDLTMYDAVLTWEELYPCYLLAEKILAKKKIAWIHPHYQECGFLRKYDFSRFNKLDGIVAVSKNCQASIQAVFPEMKEKIYAVENAVSVEDILKKSLLPQSKIVPWDGVNIVTVARLQNISKALDRAIRVSERLKKQGYAFKWYFIGDGEDRTSLIDLIRSLGMERDIILLGHQDNPYKYVKAADLFVLQSYYEGRPMVVDEAMIVGTPVLVSDYSAAREQVPADCGMVVDNNETEILLGLESLLNDKKILKEYRENLKMLDFEKYNATTRYVKLLDEVIAK